MTPIMRRKDGSPLRVGTRLLMCILIGGALAAGCGPSQQEIMAREKARIEAEARRKAAAEERRQAQEAKRREEAAKQERIRAAEAAGDEALRQGDAGTALQRYREVLKSIPRYTGQDHRVRRSAIRAAQAMAAPPALSEDVLRYLVRGEAKVKLGGAGSFAAAAQEMEKAVQEAPWFGDGYFNLGTVQEKAGKYQQAIQNFQLFLDADPRSRNAVAVRAKIFSLEVLQEDALKTLRLMGTWQELDNSKGKTNYWGVRVKDGKLLINVDPKDGSGIYVDKKGLALDGYIDMAPFTSNYCTVPGGKRPVAGTLSEDGTRMELHYEVPNYNVTSQGKVCIGVSQVGMQRYDYKLLRSEPCRLCLDAVDLPPGSAGSGGGVLVSTVYEGGPADMAGLRQGDVITSCHGRENLSDKLFTEILNGIPFGTDVPVTFTRGTEQFDVVVKAGVY